MRRFLRSRSSSEWRVVCHCHKLGAVAVRRVPLPRRRFWKGCKPNSVCAPCGTERIICLSGQDPKPDFKAGQARGAAPLCVVERAAPGFPIWPCSRWGFPCPDDYSPGGGLLPRHFTLTRLKAQISNLRFQRAVYFLWHCPSAPACAVAARVYPGRTGPGYAASRPVEFGLSSPSLRPRRFSALPKSRA